ncbi:MAG: hypothetical protein R3321_07945, partial [Nitrososphaeraceae archaeon]|nr:hypothetical protein [Nitrososphaeraceae archaeon]
MASKSFRTQCYITSLQPTYNLCKFCARRNNVSTKFKKCYSITNSCNEELYGINKCFICRGLFALINKIVKDIVYITTIENKYEFHSYFLGSSIPAFLFDNEDHFRSVFKIRGSENIKSAFNKEIRIICKKNLKKLLQPIKPDLMINLSILDNFEILIDLKPRSYYLIGRYTKKKLMIQNIKNFDSNKTESKGYPKAYSNHKISLETIVKKKLLEVTASKDIKFTWIGGEDPNSMVLGKGRFFIAEIISPQKRRITSNQVFKEDGLIFRIEEKRDSIKKFNINYISKIRAYVQTMSPITSQKLLSLRQLDNSVITHRNKSNIVQKKIYKISGKKLDEHHFVVTFLADGGLFIKQFIEKQMYSSQSVVSYMDNNYTCIKFDILG